MSILKAMISGSFKAGDGEVESFDKVTGYLPALSDEKAQQMIIKRYAKIWIGNVMRRDREGNETDEPKYKRVQRVREVFIDSIDEVGQDDPQYGETLSYVGKDIMEMSYEELQDLAAAKDLISVPLYKVGSLVNARRIAFCEYANKVLGWTETVEVPDPAGGKPRKQEKPLDWRRAGFNPAKFPTIKADGKIRLDDFEPSDIEDSIDTEALMIKHDKVAPAKEGESRLTLDQLKSIAKAKNISFHPNIGYETLYTKVYPKAA